jgi:HK97 family phage portal protein
MGAQPGPLAGSFAGALDTVITQEVPAKHVGQSAWAVAAPDLPATLAQQGGVSEGSTMSLSAAWRCQHVLSDGIGGLDIFAYDISQADARVPQPRILADPWPMVTPVEWRQMVVSSLVMHGNAYLIPFDEDPRTGYPRQLPIVHPDRVKISMAEGRPRYFLDDYATPIPMLHIRGLLPPGGVKGVGVIEAMRRGIDMALQIDRYQQGNFQWSSVPPVIIQINRSEISQEQASEIQMNWVHRHGGVSRLPAVLPASMQVTPIAWSPEDTQFLATKQFMGAEICWWFGLDPRVLGLSASGQSLTYSNIETTYVDLQRMSFMPWTSRIEAALSRVLPRTHLARFDYSPMLRTTLQDRYAAYAVALEHEFLTVDEVRALENLGPITDPSLKVGEQMQGPIDTIHGAIDHAPVTGAQEVL